MNGIKIDGKAIAETIVEELKARILAEHLTPYLEVILIGNNLSSLSYIRQKQKVGASIGATVHLTTLPPTTTDNDLKKLVQRLNQDPSIHGIIIQRPLPEESTISLETLNSIAASKDIDGFLDESVYEVPVSCAIISVLEDIYHRHFAESHDFLAWLRKQEIVVIGKGETAGKPIIKSLERLSLPVNIVDSHSVNPHELMRKATILISCVGKDTVVPASAVNKHAILMSVGLHTNSKGILVGDYNEEDIADKVFAYTPTPGGIGPINVACLMQNLVKACTLNKRSE